MCPCRLHSELDAVRAARSAAEGSSTGLQLQMAAGVARLRETEGEAARLRMQLQEVRESAGRAHQGPWRRPHARAKASMRGPPPP